jgi:hypothetical protein
MASMSRTQRALETSRRDAIDVCCHSGGQVKNRKLVQLRYQCGYLTQQCYQNLKNKCIELLIL